MSLKSPNEELADKVVLELIRKGLIYRERKEEVRIALSSGRAKAEDWRRWAEDFSREEAKDGDEDTTGKSHA